MLKEKIVQLVVESMQGLLNGIRAEDTIENSSVFVELKNEFERLQNEEVLRSEQNNENEIDVESVEDTLEDVRLRLREATELLNDISEYIKTNTDVPVEQTRVVDETINVVPHVSIDVSIEESQTETVSEDEWDEEEYDDYEDNDYEYEYGEEDEYDEEDEDEFEHEAEDEESHVVRIKNPNIEAEWSCDINSPATSYIFVAYSHLPYHYSENNQKYKLVLFSGEITAVRV